MAKIHALSEGDELDIICIEHYGFAAGAVEIVLRENIEKVFLFDNLGRVLRLGSPQSIVLPDIQKPSMVMETVRLFS